MNTCAGSSVQHLESKADKFETVNLDFDTKDSEDCRYDYNHDRAISNQDTTGSYLYSFVDLHLDEFDDTTLVTSTYLTPIWLFRWRIFAVLWCIAEIPFSILAYPKEFRVTYVSYFTTWSWWFLIVYFAMSAYNTHVFIRDNYDINKTIKKRCKIIRYFFWASYIVPTTFHPIVSVIFWTILAGPLFRAPSAIEIWLNFNVHTLNYVFVLIEFKVGRVPIFFSQWHTPAFVAGVYTLWVQAAHYMFTPQVLDYLSVQRSITNNTLTDTPGNSVIDNEKPYALNSTAGSTRIAYDNFKPVDPVLVDYYEADGFWPYPFLDTTHHVIWPVVYTVLFSGLVVVFYGIVSLHRWRDVRREREDVAVIMVPPVIPTHDYFA